MTDRRGRVTNKETSASNTHNDFRSLRYCILLGNLVLHSILEKADREGK